MGKPKLDEFLMHYRNMTNIMKRYNRILLYGLPGDGKSYLMRKIEEKYRNTEWNFYHYGETPVVSPFVWELIDPDTPVIPDFDIIYCIEYSTEYKEELTGVYFPEWRPFREYVRMMNWRKRDKINLMGRKFKKMQQLRNALNGVG